MKLLFPEELIDENLEGFKERVTRTLKLFPKAVVPRDIHGEIVYPAVNHPPDTHCKEKRLGGSRCLLSLSSPERQALQIEGEKGVKTQSAPKHWPRTRKGDFGRAIPFWPTVTVEPGRNKPCSAGFTLLRESSRRPNRYAIGKDLRDGPTVPVDPGNIRSASAEILSAKRIWPTKSLDRDKIHRPSAQNFSRPR
ncbi:unnamed protein product [Microthlaspi erraticum]|uniref:Uncharacterized protein n=1 Tax=Microthlaspi erraticum TaxID=1685480 RepID=A0A6D2KNY4_9BRAS|nr:unnamed protein product [Microthlaspi erraticum]